MEKYPSWTENQIKLAESATQFANDVLLPIEKHNTLKFTPTDRNQYKGTANLLTFRERRDSAIKNMEVWYLKELMSEAAGNIKKAIAVSGLSRARIFALLKKYDIPRFRKNKLSRS